MILFGKLYIYIYRKFGFIYCVEIKMILPQLWNAQTCKFSRDLPVILPAQLWNDTPIEIRSSTLVLCRYRSIVLLTLKHIQFTRRLEYMRNQDQNTLVHIRTRHIGSLKIIYEGMTIKSSGILAKQTPLFLKKKKIYI